MIQIPFSQSNFSKEMKPKMSGNNLTLEYENIESSLVKSAEEVAEMLGITLYGKICSLEAATGAQSEELNNTALDYLQRALLHFALYDHTIYLIAKIGNDGITVKKTDDSTTIYKYQQDALNNKIVADAWFWMNKLLQLLTTNAAYFLDWKDSEERAALESVPVGIDDFKKYVGVSDTVFMLYAGWIIREVFTECVLSRQKEGVVIGAKMRRAVCYEVMARACERLAYHCLPEPVRKDMNSEIGKNHSAQADTLIRDKIANIYQSKALAYWSAVDGEIAIAQQKAQQSKTTATYQPRKQCQEEKFAHN